jgi:hypothetical protein
LVDLVWSLGSRRQVSTLWCFIWWESCEQSFNVSFSYFYCTVPGT